MSKASRINWACVQARGVAEKVPVPDAKPGWPVGGWLSQTCSFEQERSQKIFRRRLMKTTNNAKIAPNKP
jgi:hypothetical protein